jgi:hypothetical protein
MTAHPRRAPSRIHPAGRGGKKLGGDNPDVAQTLSALGRNLLEQPKWAAAEPLLREGLAIWEAKRPDDWNRFDSQSLLGDSLLGRKNHAEAKSGRLSRGAFRALGPWASTHAGP